MKKFFISIVFVVLFIGFHTTGFTQTLLWKMSGKSLSRPSYIFGTIHMIPSADFVIHPAMDSLLLSSGKLVMEMDLSDPTLQLKVMQQMMMDSDRSLSDLYKPGEFKKLKAMVLEKFGMSLDVLIKFKPIFTQQLLVTKAIMGKDTKSYEKYFMDVAGRRQIQLVGLETVEEQVKALTSIPESRQAQMLKESVMNFEKDKKELELMIDLYKKQDIEGLYKMTTSEQKYKDFEEDLLVKRNQNWVPKIAELAGSESVFVAVGAAHLGGAKGILQLLRQEGYVIEPVK